MYIYTLNTVYTVYIYTLYTVYTLVYNNHQWLLCSPISATNYNYNIRMIINNDMRTSIMRRIPKGYLYYLEL